MDDLRNKRDEAPSAIKLAQETQKEYVDSKRSDKQFAGNLVVLKFKRFGLGNKPPKTDGNKLGPTSTPVRIIRKISPLVYMVALPAESKPMTWSTCFTSRSTGKISVMCDPFLSNRTPCFYQEINSFVQEVH